MKHQHVIFFILIFLASFFAEAQAVPVCEARFINDHEFTYNFKGRTAHVIGWNHGSPSDQENILKAMQEALDKSTQGEDCKGAEMALRRYIETAVARMKESNHVVSSLETAYSKKSFDVVGVEYSPEEWKEIFDPVKDEHKINPILLALNSRCPNITSSTGDILKLFDPAYYFYRNSKENKRKMKIEAMESQALKALSLKGVALETLNFDPEKEVLSPLAKARILQTQAKIKLGLSPSDADIREIINAESNPNQKAKIFRVFMDLKRVMDILDQRSDFVAQQFQRGQGNYAITIGNTHLKRVSEELTRLCKK